MRTFLRFAVLTALTVPLAQRAHAQTPPAPSPAPSEDAQDAEDAEDAEEVEADDAAPSAPAGSEKKEAPAEGAAEDAADAAEGEGDAADLADEGEEAPEEPSHAPAAGKGAIWGVVTDTEFSEELIEAPIQVIGTKYQTVTDENGRFRLELPPGTYSIRISYELHKSTRIDGVTVAAGGVVRVDAKLVADEGAVDVFEVVESADKATLEGMILARQRATTVGDSVGRAEISKTADRNAAQAAQRVVGATVVGGRFVYVRGLGERYTNALVNGAPLPSPEPDRAAVPLDMFATGVLNSLTIVKTFTPEFPGDFAGGSVRIETREIPNKPYLQLNAAVGFNTNSTFNERLSYRGGGLDWLGVDDGTRALPEGFPNYPVIGGAPVKPGGEVVTDQDVQQAGLMLNSYMSATRAGTAPNHGFSAVGGNGWDFGNDRKLGVLASINYGRSFTVREGEIIRDYVGDPSDPRGVTESRNYVSTLGSDNVQWGGFGSVTYRLSSRHELSLIGLRSTLSDNKAQYVQGFNKDRNQDIWGTRLTFVTRALNFGLLSGKHRFADANSPELEWNLSLSNALRDEPDRRDTVWGSSNGNPYQFTNVKESGRHFFSEQSEKQFGGGIDYTQPLGGLDNKLKTGGLVSLRDRNFHARILRFQETSGRNSVPSVPCASGNIDACNDALFVPENIGPTLELEETTDGGDSYDAFLNIYAVYVMADLGLTKDVRAIVGERIEHTFQVVDPYQQFTSIDEGERAEIRQTDLLPAVSAVWSPTKKAKLRGSVTKTLARPQLLELAPFTYEDYFGGRLKSGYKDLQMTSITNVDARFEFFPTLRDVLAASVFFKNFTDPIEPVIIGETLSYRNAESASLVGIELEARRNLEALADALKDFSVVTNLTLARSKVEIDASGVIQLTNPSRALVNQAPWVFNFALDYNREKSKTSARALFNVVGPRIVEVGTAGLDDVYEHPRASLDLTVQQAFGKLSVKAEAKNILNTNYVRTMGCGGDGLWDSTWYFTCSAGDEVLVNKYDEGVTLNLGASYEF